MSRHFVWLIPLTTSWLSWPWGLSCRVVVLVWRRRGGWLAARLLCALTLLPATWWPFRGSTVLPGWLVALGCRGAAGPGHRAACHRLPAAGPGQLPVVAGLVPCWRRLSWAATGSRNGARRDGRFRRRAPPTCSSSCWTRWRRTTWASMATTVPPARRSMSWRPRDSLRSRASDLVVDVAISCEHVYGTMASRALRRLVYSARCHLSHARRIPGFSRLRHGGIRRQQFVLCVRLGTGPRFRRLSRPYLSRGSPPSRTAALVNRPLDWLNEAERSSRIGWISICCDPRYNNSGGFQGRSQRVRRWSIASSSTGSPAVDSPSGPFFAFLNYFDAHCPYRASAGRIHRFGTEPARHRDSDLIQNWWPLDKKQALHSGACPCLERLRRLHRRSR